MVFRALADATVAVHLAFVGFVLLGGLSRCGGLASPGCTCPR